ncbi:MAG: PEP-CTERM sorting domain-containing protein [Puniceicoccaceae bacterium]
MSLTKKTLSLAVAFIVGVSAYAQSVNFQIEVDQIFAGGVDQNPGDVNVYSSMVSLVDFNALSFSSTPLASEINALATNPIFDVAWEALTTPPPPFDTILDWSTSRTFTEDQNGLVPVILITQGTVGSLTGGEYVGIVASSTAVFNSLAPFLVNFNGAGDTWDTFKLGTSGSINLVQTAVPEPAHYAALLGAVGLMFVMWRRRR